jgi:hypothetical protein
MFLRSVLQLLVTANVDSSSPILSTLMKEATLSPESRFLQELHNVKSQKTAFFLVTAVNASILRSLDTPDVHGTARLPNMLPAAHRGSCKPLVSLVLGGH